MFMAFSVTVLRFGMGLNFPPPELMDRANQVMISDQNSKMFATVFACYLDLTTSEMEFASAGHNPPILYRAATGSVEYLEASGVAMGLFTAAEYDGGKTTLESGDILVIYTDGLTETINPQEEEFGEERLEQLIIDNASRSAQELTDLIKQAVADFPGNGTIFDDETLVVLKRV